MYPHRIRLRGPWDLVPLARAGGGELPAPVRAAHPCRWSDAGLAGFVGRVRHLRRFGMPRTLSPGEHVWLTAADLTETAEVTLNGIRLGAVAGSFEFEVTALLRQRNELFVDVEAADDTGGLPGEVALEVRATAYLRDVTLAADRSAIRGEVAGASDSPLDLYILADGQPTIHRSVGVGPFSVPLPTGVAPVRVELVHGGVVWYSADL